MKFIGDRVLRKEDPRLLTGRGRYVGDVVLPGMLHAALVRSPHAHALVVRLDAGRARAHPGVHDTVFTGVTSQGQGLETTLAQVCASELGVTPPSSRRSSTTRRASS